MALCSSLIIDSLQAKEDLTWIIKKKQRCDFSKNIDKKNKSVIIKPCLFGSKCKKQNTSCNFDHSDTPLTEKINNLYNSLESSQEENIYLKKQIAKLENDYASNKDDLIILNLKKQLADVTNYSTNLEKLCYLQSLEKKDLVDNIENLSIEVSNYRKDAIDRLSIELHKTESELNNKINIIEICKNDNSKHKFVEQHINSVGDICSKIENLNIEISDLKSKIN